MTKLDKLTENYLRMHKTFLSYIDDFKLMFCEVRELILINFKDKGQGYLSSDRKGLSALCIQI